MNEYLVVLKNGRFFTIKAKAIGAGKLTTPSFIGEDGKPIEDILIKAEETAAIIKTEHFAVLPK